MRVTIVRDDGVVLKDRRALEIDLSDFPANIHAIQWDGVAGHVEYNDGKPHAKITDLVSFQTWIDRWQAAADAEDAPPPPPTTEQLAAEAALQALIASKAEAKADTVVQYLRDHTVAECVQYVDTNVTDLASAKAFLKKVAAMMCVLSKEM